MESITLTGSNDKLVTIFIKHIIAVSEHPTNSKWARVYTSSEIFAVKHTMDEVYGKIKEA